MIRGVEPFPVNRLYGLNASESSAEFPVSCYISAFLRPPNQILGHAQESMEQGRLHALTSVCVWERDCCSAGFRIFPTVVRKGKRDFFFWWGTLLPVSLCNSRKDVF